MSPLNLVGLTSLFSIFYLPGIQCNFFNSALIQQSNLTSNHRNSSEYKLAIRKGRFLPGLSFLTGFGLGSLSSLPLALQEPDNQPKPKPSMVPISLVDLRTPAPPLSNEQNILSFFKSLNSMCRFFQNFKSQLTDDGETPTVQTPAPMQMIPVDVPVIAGSDDYEEVLSENQPFVTGNRISSKKKPINYTKKPFLRQRRPPPQDFDIDRNEEGHRPPFDRNDPGSMFPEGASLSTRADQPKASMMTEPTVKTTTTTTTPRPTTTTTTTTPRPTTTTHKTTTTIAAINSTDFSYFGGSPQNLSGIHLINYQHYQPYINEVPYHHLPVYEPAPFHHEYEQPAEIYPEIPYQWPPVYPYRYYENPTSSSSKTQPWVNENSGFIPISSN